MVIKFVSIIRWQPNLEKVFLGYMNFRMQSMIHFLTPCSHLGFVSLVAPLQPLHGTLGELR